MLEKQYGDLEADVGYQARRIKELEAERDELKQQSKTLRTTNQKLQGQVETLARLVKTYENAQDGWNKVLREWRPKQEERKR